MTKKKANNWAVGGLIADTGGAYAAGTTKFSANEVPKHIGKDIYLDEDECIPSEEENLADVYEYSQLPAVTN